MSDYKVGDRVEWQDRIAPTRSQQETIPWTPMGEVVKVLPFARLLDVRTADGSVMRVRMVRVRKMEVR